MMTTVTTEENEGKKISFNDLAELIYLRKKG